MMPTDIIVKVQVPMWSGEIDPPVLLYTRGKKWVATMTRSELPAPVWDAAAAHGGMAYFHMTETDELMSFGDEAGTQDW